MKKELPKVLTVIVLLTLVSVAIWMNRYQYQQAGTRLVRIDRFTGQGCYFQGDGTWDSRAIPPAKPDVFAKYGGHEISPEGQKDASQNPSIFDAFVPSGETNKCQ